eukprot:scaffold10897_cov102-Isochrysis_galbana.AAC.6
MNKIPPCPLSSNAARRHPLPTAANPSPSRSASLSLRPAIHKEIWTPRQAVLHYPRLCCPCSTLRSGFSSSLYIVALSTFDTRGKYGRRTRRPIEHPSWATACHPPPDAPSRLVHQRCTITCAASRSACGFSMVAGALGVLPSAICSNSPRKILPLRVFGSAGRVMACLKAATGPTCSRTICTT